MFADVENQVCVAQAFTGAATVSTHSYQKQSAAQDISKGRRMGWLVHVDVAAGAGSTHTMEAVQADNAALTSNLEVLNSQTILAATLVAGYEFLLPIPPDVMTKQFLGFRNTSTGGTTTVTLSVYLIPEDEFAKYKSFPKIVDAAVD